MSTKFSETLRSLRDDRAREAYALAAVGVVVLGAWLVWSVASRVTVLETSTTARLEASVAVHAVQAEVSGRVLGSELRLGRVVAAGDVLLELDGRTERLLLEETKARRDGIERQLAALTGEIETREQVRRSASSALQTAVLESKVHGEEAVDRQTQAREEMERLARLRDGGHIGEIELLRASTEAKSRAAQAAALALSSQRLTAEAQSKDSEQLAAITELRKQKASLEAELGTLGATIDRLTVDVERRTLRAPIAGTLGDVAVLPTGTYVAAGTKLCSIVPEAPLKVVAELPWSTALGRVRPGQHAYVRLTGFPWLEYGAVDAIVTSVATEAPKGTVRAELRLEGSSSSTAPLQHGLAATVLVEVDRVAPLTLLARSIGRGLSGRAPEMPPEAGR